MTTAFQVAQLHPMFPSRNQVALEVKSAFREVRMQLLGFRSRNRENYVSRAPYGNSYRTRLNYRNFCE